MKQAVITIKGEFDGSPDHHQFYENLYDSFAEFALAAGEDFDMELAVSLDTDAESDD